MERCGVFYYECKEWRKRPANLKTWAILKQVFGEAHADFKDFAEYCQDCWLSEPSKVGLTTVTLTPTFHLVNAFLLDDYTVCVDIAIVHAIWL